MSAILSPAGVILGMSTAHVSTLTSPPMAPEPLPIIGLAATAAPHPPKPWFMVRPESNPLIMTGHSVTIGWVQANGLEYTLTTPITRTLDIWISPLPPRLRSHRILNTE